MSERLSALPKAELHVHLDGSLRPQTLIDLAREVDYELPTTEVVELSRAMLAAPGSDLEAYLARFQTTVAVLQTARALERVAFELAIDAHRDGVHYIEVRFAPVLCTRLALGMGDAISAASRGLKRAAAATGMGWGVIVCALRQLEPIASEEAADVAVSLAHDGVVGFDLAGPEEGHPPGPHAAAFDRAARAGLGITVHAGEAAGPASIREAIDRCHAMRIGHGTALPADSGLMRVVRDRRIAIEACITSNVQTGAVSAAAQHPVRDLLDFGINVSLNTDNRLVSGVTLIEEYELARDALGLAWADWIQLARNGFEAAFIPVIEKARRLEDFDELTANL